MSSSYDLIGIDYAKLRKPDPRIAALIDTALGDAGSVLNVGAGAGSYEPRGRPVTALEPSAEMIRQRPDDAAPAVQGSADALPFDDKSFDATMAILTVHHWTDKAKCFRELKRVTRKRTVILTYDPAFRGQWLTDYFPELITLDDASMPAMADYERWLGPVTVSPVNVPHDCCDGFLYAWWRRPHDYLDARIRKGMSSFWKISGVEEGLARLEDDLQSGRWVELYGAVMALDSLDTGYRLVVAEY